MISSKNSAMPIHKLCLASELSSLEVNGAKLQYHTQPVDRCVAVFGRKLQGFSILDNPFKSCFALKCLSELTK